MVVRFVASRKREKSNVLARLLKNNHIDYELIRAEDLEAEGTHLYAATEQPVVEIDGEIFVNPNPQALLKALAGERAGDY
ncbi:MAG TPA: hypothetical protein VMS56_05130 [Thermoanaerobaculia bacterium]|nr:hypothetical protein [Thermoanaerobaculia bacterium]